MTPVQMQTLLQQGLTHHQAGRVAAAAQIYAQIYQALPQQFEALHLGGTAALQLGNLAEAQTLLSRAVKINAHVGTTFMCLGLAQASLGRNAEAEASLRRAVQLEPKNHEAWGNLASVLVINNRMDEATKAYQRSIEIQPSYAQGWTGLGSVLQLNGRAHEAIQHHTRALELEPTHPKARFARAQANQLCHRVTEALNDFEAHIVSQPSHHEARCYRLFILNYLPEISRERLYAEHLDFGRAVAADNPPVQNLSYSKDAGKKLRVAFLSPDLRTHSVAFFLEPLLRHLDRTQFEIILYHDHYSVDGVSNRLRTLASLWRNFVGQPADAVEAQIRADAPDILVDLAGHTGFNRLPLFSRRLAPVQLAYLGYPNTSGLQAMDYRLTDAVADPVGDSDAFHTERLVRFAPTAWTYEPPTEAPLPAPVPSVHGQPLSFGSFNNFSKINSYTLKLWSELLEAVPGSRLVLKSFGLVITETRERLRSAGLDMNRVLLLTANTTLKDHLACYSQIDIALDPFPYHGTTTTCEALWMGVPVISLRGERHASRVGTSLLQAVGHPELVAETREDYLRIATQLANDPTRLAALRAGLRDDLKHSPLLDHTGQSAAFGRALRDCWQQHCAGPQAKSSTSPLCTSIP